MPELTVLYFAHLRDQRGLDSERITSTATTARYLYRELVQRHGLTLPERTLIVAVNEAMVRWDAPLADGDTVVFLPPVSGG
ncbi:MAG: molybdopterin converting factor subunit 1 [Planctomycetes bacterium]|nr:molybdopterin converting factor subunit 1 [Planctomycetota bacterium]